MSEIKKVTLQELAKLDVWKMRVTPEISERVQRYLIDNIKTRWSSSNIQVVRNIGDNKTLLYFEFGLFTFDNDNADLHFRASSHQEVELKIKKVTIEELYKLDAWKMKDVSHDVYKKINKVFNNRLLIGDYFENGDCNLDLYYDRDYNGITWTKNDIGYFDKHDDNYSEVQLTEENEVKKVDLQYLLDNDKWQLKVTPEQSEMVQLALFDVGVDWNIQGKSVSHIEHKYLSREGNSLFFGENKYLDLVDFVEQQPPQYDFDTQQEIFRWLDDGGLIKCIDSRTEYGMHNGFVVTINNNLRANNLFFNIPSRWKKVTNWYDKLDGTAKNARLCYVKLVSANGVFVNIYSHEEGDFRDKNGSQWISPTPLTNDEIKAFMVGE